VTYNRITLPSNQFNYQSKHHHGRPLKRTCSVPSTGENAYGVIANRLPDLDIGKPGVETTKFASLPFTYIGELAEWPSWHEELTKFHNTPKLHDAFERAEKIGLGLAPDWSEDYFGIGEKESIQTSDEITMSGAFFTHVLAQVAKVIDVLTHPEVHSTEDLAAMTHLPARDVKTGSSKCVPINQRVQSFEPDIVLKIPGTRDYQKARLIGGTVRPKIRVRIHIQPDHLPQDYSAREQAKGIFPAVFTHR
jgi:hypothetical protein